VKIMKKLLATMMMVVFLGSCATVPVTPPIPPGCEDSISYKIPMFTIRGQFILEAGIVTLCILEPSVKPQMIEGLRIARTSIIQGNLGQALMVLSLRLSQFLPDERLRLAATSAIVILSAAQLFAQQTPVITACDQKIFTELIDRILLKLDTLY